VPRAATASSLFDTFRSSKRAAAAAVARAAKADSARTDAEPDAPEIERSRSWGASRGLRAGATMSARPHIGLPDATDWPSPLASPIRQCHRRSASSPAVGAAGSPAGGVGGVGGMQYFSRELTMRVQALLEAELGRLQERVQAVLVDATAPDGTSETAVSSLSRRLGWVRSDLAALRPHVLANKLNKEDGPPTDLCAVASAAEDFTYSLRHELRAGKAIKAEEAYGEKVAAGLGARIIHVRRDGDCLFRAAVAWRAANVRREATVGDAEAEAKLAAADAMDPARADMAHEMRLQVVRWLRVQLECAAPHVTEAVDLRVAEAVGSEASRDGTSSLLREELQPSFARGETLGSPAAREAYLRVMARRGTFGERLEVCAISALLGCPVELYYYLDGDGDATAALPKETIAAEAASPSVAKGGGPLRLLHAITARHFDLLL